MQINTIGPLRGPVVGPSEKNENEPSRALASRFSPESEDLPSSKLTSPEIAPATNPISPIPAVPSI